jgi:alginate O-acetyltransferase complex protein AlgI
VPFDRPTFWVFFAFAYLAWRKLPFGAAKTATLFASLLFYGWFSFWYLPLILASACVDFAAAIKIAGAPTPRARRGWLVLSLCANLGLLSFFKYAPFAVDNARWVALQLGLEPPPPLEDWILPVGISFFTFQSMTYTIDTYRGLITPVRSFRDFLLYISFFPQLVAGPIVRARSFLPQLRARTALPPIALQAGLYEIALGLFLKVVVADNLAPAVEQCFDRMPLERLSPAQAWLGTFYFGGQIFADFAGYSAIAIGLARVMGLTFPENFKAPYIATSLSEFWRRWHVSLSTWLRDYLYIPLGGNRHGPARTYMALFLTMLLGGLWHGASWNFVLWGGAHGAGLAVERALTRGRRKPNGLVALVRWAAVLLFVHLTWVFFRAQGFERAIGMLERMLVAPWREGWGAGEFNNARYVVFLVPIAIVHLARLLEEKRLLPSPAYVRAALAGLMLALLFVVGRPSPSAFLYFQF